MAGILDSLKRLLSGSGKAGSSETPMHTHGPDEPEHDHPHDPGGMATPEGREALLGLDEERER